MLHEILKGIGTILTFLRYKILEKDQKKTTATLGIEPGRPRQNIKNLTLHRSPLSKDDFKKWRWK